MRNPVYAETISKAILQLNKVFPGTTIGEHIINALNGVDLYNVTDKEFANLITEYWATLTLDRYKAANPDEYNE
jgi:hypothetical protein